jgi:hypothetical protein
MCNELIVANTVLSKYESLIDKIIENASYIDLMTTNFDRFQDQSYTYLSDLCKKTLEEINSLNLYEVYRRIGYVQAVLMSKDQINIKKEVEFIRRLNRFEYVRSMNA